MADAVSLAATTLPLLQERLQQEQLQLENLSAGNASGKGPLQLEQVGDCLSLSINFVMIVAGNVTLLVHINSRPKSRMTYFITNLAAADLCVGLFVVLPQFVDRVLMQFYGPDFLCRIRWFLQIVVGYEASYALVALSIDRVDAIANPLRASTANRGLQSACIIGGSWVLSALYSLPTLLSAQTMQHPKYGRQCILLLGGGANATKEQQQRLWQLFVTYSLVTVNIIPVIVVAVCHIALVVVIFRSGRGPKALASGRGRPGGSACATNRTTVTRAKVKSVKITCTIVSVFTLCWLPYTVGSLLDAYNPVLSANAKILIQTLGTLNSAANPIIFFVFNYNQCCQSDSSRRPANREDPSNKRGPRYEKVALQLETRERGGASPLGSTPRNSCVSMATTSLRPEAPGSDAGRSD